MDATVIHRQAALDARPKRRAVAGCHLYLSPSALDRVAVAGVVG